MTNHERGARRLQCHLIWVCAGSVCCCVLLLLQLPTAGGVDCNVVVVLR